jgi:phenylacetate-coenzyme A ligase PaaK-like adenylate-forming protein
MAININDIFSIDSDKKFEELCLKIYKYQYNNNEIYNDYSNKLHKTPANVIQIEDIPFLPIEFFKTHKILCNELSHQIIFTSSGTTGINTSKHYVADLSIYEKSFISSFRKYLCNEQDVIILGLLPSYLEREGSSLIYMVKKLIENSNNKLSGFFLNEFDKLENIIANNTDKKIILFGVSFALLDFGNFINQKLPHITIVETGGMKGQRKEITKQEMYATLKEQFGVSNINSEYGMTELLSQAYSQEDEKYTCPPWMKVLIREVNDPFSYETNGGGGGINVIDLANIHSCSFVETKDIGVKIDEHHFKVIGRMDNSDTRGCNTMITN